MFARPRNTRILREIGGFMMDLDRGKKYSQRCNEKNKKSLEQGKTYT